MLRQASTGTLSEPSSPPEPSIFWGALTEIETPSRCGGRFVSVSRPFDGLTKPWGSRPSQLRCGRNDEFRTIQGDFMTASGWLCIVGSRCHLDLNTHTASDTFNSPDQCGTVMPRSPNGEEIPEQDDTILIDPFRLKDIRGGYIALLHDGVIHSRLNGPMATSSRCGVQDTSEQ